MLLTVQQLPLCIFAVLLLLPLNPSFHFHPLTTTSPVIRFLFITLQSTLITYLNIPAINSFFTIFLLHAFPSSTLFQLHPFLFILPTTFFSLTHHCVLIITPLLLIIFYSLKIIPQFSFLIRILFILIEIFLIPFPLIYFLVYLFIPSFLNYHLLLIVQFLIFHLNFPFPLLIY